MTYKTDISCKVPLSPHEDVHTFLKALRRHVGCQEETSWKQEASSAAPFSPQYIKLLSTTELTPFCFILFLDSKLTSPLSPHAVSTMDDVYLFIIICFWSSNFCQAWQFKFLLGMTIPNSAGHDNIFILLFCLAVSLDMHNVDLQTDCLSVNLDIYNVNLHTACLSVNLDIHNVDLFTVC